MKNVPAFLIFLQFVPSGIENQKLSLNSCGHSDYVRKQNRHIYRYLFLSIYGP